jgi:2-iminobutanoate/2-iminopropanoate deaminase
MYRLGDQGSALNELLWDHIEMSEPGAPGPSDPAAGAQFRIVDPASIASPPANYAHGIVTTGASRWLHTAGVVPIAPDGSTPDVLIEQARVVWANIEAIVAEAGMDLGRIVSLTTYVVAEQLDDPASLASVMAVRDEMLGGRLVASTLVTVPELARPEWLIEISVTAAA